MIKWIIHISILSFFWFATDVPSESSFQSLIAPLVFGSYLFVLVISILYKIGLLKGTPVPGKFSDCSGGGFYSGGFGGGDSGGGDGGGC